MSEYRMLNPGELRFVAFTDEDDKEGCLTTLHIVRKLFIHGQVTKPACGYDGTLKYRFRFHWFLWKSPLVCLECKRRTREELAEYD